jgi:PAS domain S-box-containing protein
MAKQTKQRKTAPRPRQRGLARAGAPAPATTEPAAGPDRLLADAIAWLPDATFVIDREKRVVAWNRACEVMTGVRQEALLGKGDYAYAEPFFGDRRPILIDLLDVPAPEVEAAYKYVERRGDAVVAESFIQRLRGGRGAHLWGVASPLFDREGRRCGAIEVVRDITDQKSTEQALRESRQRLLTAQRVARVGFLDWNLETNEVFLSDETCEITGYRPQGELTTPDFVARTVHPDDVTNVGEQLNQAIQGLKPYDVVHRHLRPDGRVVWVHAQAELSRDASGRPVRLLGTIVDITEQKRAELALRENELKYRMLFETAGDAILLMRYDRFVDCNIQALEVYGTTREHMVGARPYEFSPPEQPDGRSSSEKALERISLALTEGPQRFEWLHCREDGTPFMAEVSLNRLELGDKTLLQAIVRDITDRKRAEEELRFRNAILSTQQETSLDGILVVDGKGGIVSSNRRFAEMWGVPPDVMASGSEGRVLLAVTGLLADPDEALNKVEYLYEHLDEKSGDEIALKDGRTIERYSAPMLAADGRYLGRVWYYRDITARKQAEAEHERLEAMLRDLSAHIEAEREDERTGIAREIHDQLGQALTAIKMDLSWITRRATSPGGLSREDLVEKVKSLQQMADEIIAEVRRISSELRPPILDHFGLAAALSWSAQELEKRTPIACGVRSDLAEDRQLDRGLASAVFRVFQEALTNVVRHAGAARVDVHLLEDAGALVLEVRDDGRGISPAQIDDPRSLGLLGIRERARRLGGTATIARGAGRGTVLTLRVPLRSA